MPQRVQHSHEIHEQHKNSRSKKVYAEDVSSHVLMFYPFIMEGLLWRTQEKSRMSTLTQPAQYMDIALPSAHVNTSELRWFFYGLNYN